MISSLRPLTETELQEGTVYTKVSVLSVSTGSATCELANLTYSECILCLLPKWNALLTKAAPERWFSVTDSRPALSQLPCVVATFATFEFGTNATVTSEYRAECPGSKAGGQRTRDSAFASDTRNLRQPSVISVGLDGPHDIYIEFTMPTQLTFRCQWVWGGAGNDMQWDLFKLDFGHFIFLCDSESNTDVIYSGWLVMHGICTQVTTFADFLLTPVLH